MRTCKSILGPIGGGIVVTLITGLYKGSSLIGATGYGFPMVWLRRLIIAPQYNPWRIGWVGLLVDILIWAVIIELLIFVYCSINCKPKAQEKKSARRRRR